VHTIYLKAEVTQEKFRSLEIVENHNLFILTEHISHIQKTTWKLHC